MIISVTGKPCSGKGTICNLFCAKYSFEYIGMGKIFRTLSMQKGFANVTEFQSSAEAKEVDKAVDNELINIGKTRNGENLMIDSRTAWHFVPNSFKVYVDVSLEEASKRLLNANREEEQANNEEEAKQMLLSRYNSENARYKELYNIDCTNLNNFDCVLNSTHLSTEELCTQLYNEYLKFINAK